MSMNQICEWSEIAGNFDRACEDTKKTNTEIAKIAGVAGSDVGRTRAGSKVPSIIKFTKLCLAVQKTPDQLVFRENLPAALPILNLSFENVQRLLRLARVFIKMETISPDGIPMAEIFAAEAETALQITEEHFARKKAAALPPGSNVQRRDGVTTYQPPVMKGMDSALRKGASRVSEAATVYGKKKK